jgi:trehalose 2-sulfotransferase
MGRTSGTMAGWSCQKRVTSCAPARAAAPSCYAAAWQRRASPAAPRNTSWPRILPSFRTGFWEEGPYAAGHDVSDKEIYLTLVYRLGSTPNGVFGAKIHWNTLRWALAKFSEMPRFAGLDRVAILHTAFPDLRVVDVTRRDRVRQAVSWARMAQDGMWVDPVGQPEPASPHATGLPRYDYELIAALEALIAEGETGWRQLYNELGLTPYRVVYEELSSRDGYEPTIRGVLVHLGLADYRGPIPIPQTRRQSNDLNEAWVDAYLADSAIDRRAGTCKNVGPKVADLGGPCEDLNLGRSSDQL